MKIYADGFYCFGCGANGDIFDFVQRMEGVSFKDAFLSLGGTYPEYQAQQKTESMLYDRFHLIRDRMTAAFKKQNTDISDLEEKRRQLHDSAFWLSVYARGMDLLEPMSDEWCFCAHHIEYENYKMETLLDEVWKEVKRLDRRRT